LRENAEGVALYQGERDEGQVLDTRFRSIVANYRRIMSRTRSLNAMTVTYAEIAGVFPWFAAAPLYFSKKISFGTLSRVAGAFGEVQSSASWFVDNYATLAEWASNVERLATFSRTLDSLHAAGDGQFVAASSADAAVKADDLTVALPDGTVLLDRAALQFERGVSTAITGRSGGGKSTLFRTLAGIWPFGSGTITRPAGTVLFLPQKPYIPLGTLRRAVCYPAAVDTYPDSAVRAALVDAGLGHLTAELDLDAAWAQRLSGGEQQRLALARALLTRPDWLFMDEATASLDPAGQAELYRILRERLPQTGIVSIAHAPEVVALHDRQLVLRRAPEGGTLLAAE
jgi:putative ATP-binding cassette transporter